MTTIDALGTNHGALIAHALTEAAPANGMQLQRPLANVRHGNSAWSLPHSFCLRLRNTPSYYLPLKRFRWGGRRRTFLTCGVERFVPPSFDSVIESSSERQMECPGGGIGRHAGLRSLCLQAWGFESPLGHHLTTNPAEGGIRQRTAPATASPIGIRVNGNPVPRGRRHLPTVAS